MLSPSLMPNLPCHATPAILKPPPSADTVSWKTLDSTFSPSDPTYYRLVSGEQSYFLSFHWWQLPWTTYIPWPTSKCLDCNVSLCASPLFSWPNSSLSPLCFGHKPCRESFLRCSFSDQLFSAGVLLQSSILVMAFMLITLISAVHKRT